MRLPKIKTYLSPYRIYGRGSTTVSYAFASAVAPVERYDPDLVGEALCLLGQDPAAELTCAYCDAPATSWDHLVGVVKDGRYSGFDHVLGNLVPCCGACNGRKGNKPWRSFVDSIPDPARRALVTERIERMVMRFLGTDGTPPPSPHSQQILAEVEAIRDEIHRLMHKADASLAPGLAEASAMVEEDGVAPKRIQPLENAGQKAELYAEVFNLLEPAIATPKLQDKSWQPFRSGPFGGFWIWLTSEELRVVCYLDTRLKEIVDQGTFNGELFSLLLSEQDEIEAITGADLVWEGLPGRKACWIGLTRPRPNLSHDSERTEAAAWPPIPRGRCLRRSKGGPGSRPPSFAGASKPRRRFATPTLTMEVLYHAGTGRPDSNTSRTARSSTYLDTSSGLP